MRIKKLFNLLFFTKEYKSFFVCLKKSVRTVLISLQWSFYSYFYGRKGFSRNVQADVCALKTDLQTHKSEVGYRLDRIEDKLDEVYKARDTVTMRFGFFWGFASFMIKENIV